MHGFNIAKEREKQLQGKRPFPYAIKLHMELDTSQAYLDKHEKALLKKYGKMNTAISRDIIVPGDITLHALHYVLNRAFGWTNSHLHCFHPSDSDFAKMIKNKKLSEWKLFTGMYFRFPSEDYHDIYWDDNYDDDTLSGLRLWFKRKYKGPYYYGGYGEFFDNCQREINALYKRFPILEVRKPFWESYDEKQSLNSKQNKDNSKQDDIKRVAKINDVTLDELSDTIMFEGGGFNQLIERLPLYDILLMPGMKQDFATWYFDSRVVLRQCQQEEEILAPVTFPILKELLYWYDYGEDWKVKIVASEVYKTGSAYLQTSYPTYQLKVHRPVCVASDGLALCDDVGGINGYCDMLQALHGDDLRAKYNYQQWSKGQGWTGKPIMPERLL